MDVLKHTGELEAELKLNSLNLDAEDAIEWQLVLLRATGYTRSISQAGDL